MKTFGSLSSVGECYGKMRGGVSCSHVGARNYGNGIYPPNFKLQTCTTISARERPRPRLVRVITLSIHVLHIYDARA